MELEEEARVIEKQAFRARANLRKVALYCQGKGMDELRARYVSRRPSHDAGGGLFFEFESLEDVGAVAACQRDSATSRHRDAIDATARESTDRFQ